MTSPKRGLAALPPEQRQAIARQGGQAAHAAGTAHIYDPESARIAGKKGGLAVSRDSAYMAELGRKGGLARAANVARQRALRRAGLA